MVRNAGAREIHMRVAAPPTTHSCYYGIDTPERDKLLASHYDVAGMAKLIKVDSLAFLSIDGLYRAMGMPGGRNPANPGFCDACFTGDYPISLDDQLDVEDRQLSFLAEPA
jgi:amidophosphoribosyltransferase